MEQTQPEEAALVPLSVPAERALEELWIFRGCRVDVGQRTASQVIHSSSARRLVNMGFARQHGSPGGWNRVQITEAGIKRAEQIPRIKAILEGNKTP